MTFEQFIKLIPNESKAVEFWRFQREKEGILCKNCGSNEHYWLSPKRQWQCKTCRFRTGIRSGSVMQDSNLKVSIWLKTMFLMTFSKKGISACEMQRQLGMKRYEPVWFMMHKIRGCMGKRDDKYILKGSLEMDDCFVSVVHKEGASKDSPIKRGRGSQKKRSILMMVETEKVENPKTYRKSTKPKYIKLIAMKDLSAENVNETIGTTVSEDAKIKTDGFRGFKRLKSIINRHEQTTVPSKQAHIMLPWVHTFIGNLKRVLNGIYHRVSDKYLQSYLDEFSYKTNRRYILGQLFSRAAIAGSAFKW